MRNLSLFVMLGMAVLLGCSKEDNKLYGSVSAVYSLDFDSVQIVRVGGQVSVEYQRSSGAKAAKLTVTVSDLANLAGNKIDLTEMVGGLPRGTMQRVESSTTDFPIKTGNVVFDQEPTAGTSLSGSFHTTLSNPDGRTLNGDFHATVQGL
jgi:hypothetical protein